MTRTIKRDIVDIVTPNTLTKAGVAINRAQEIASGYSNSMEVFKKAIGHSALHEALERHTRLQTAIEGTLPRTRLDNYYAAMNDALSFSAVNAFEDFTRRHKAISDSFTKYNNVFENIDTAASLARKLISASNIKAALGEDFDALTYSFQDLIPYPAVTSAYDDLLREFSKHKDLVVEANNDGVISRQLDTIIEKLETSVATDLPAPKSISEHWDQINRMITVVSLILAILSLVYAKQQSIAADEQHSQIMNILNRQLHVTEALMQQYDKEKSHKITYTVTRATPVCSEQKFCTHEIMRLHPTQKVEALDFDRKWVLIEAYDTLSEKTHRGWVLKKYMRLDRTSAEHIPTKAKDVEIDFNFDNLND